MRISEDMQNGEGICISGEQRVKNGNKDQYDQ